MIKNIVIASFLTVLSVSSHASFLFGVSNGGKSDSTSATLGFRGEKWGGSVSVGFSNDYNSDDVLDYETPHSSYIIVDKDAYVGNTYGFDVIRFFDFKANQSVYIGAGAYFSTQCDVARSTATNWLYCHDEENNIDPALSLGYMINVSEFSLGLGYHTERGVDLMVGTKF